MLPEGVEDLPKKITTAVATAYTIVPIGGLTRKDS